MVKAEIRIGAQDGRAGGFFSIGNPLRNFAQAICEIERPEQAPACLGNHRQARGVGVIIQQALDSIECSSFIRDINRFKG